jgi:predicted nucleic acid-binding protein
VLGAIGDEKAAARRRDRHADLSAINRVEHPSVCREVAAALNVRQIVTCSVADVLIAAAAQEAGVGVLHYDRLAEVLHFRSVWLAPAGSL